MGLINYTISKGRYNSVKFIDFINELEESLEIE